MGNNEKRETLRLSKLIDRGSQLKAAPVITRAGRWYFEGDAIVQRVRAREGLKRECRLRFEVGSRRTTAERRPASPTKRAQTATAAAS